MTIALILMSVHHLSDLLYQADQHGWTLFGWKVNLPCWSKWVWWLDWIPHDPWHWIQSIRNTSIWVASALIAIEYAMHPVAYVILAVGITYAICRAIFFTVPMWFRT